MQDNINMLKAATMIELFIFFRDSHPNLSKCWIEYLELKKRHCSNKDIEQSLLVLYNIAAGCKDLKREDIVRLLLYDISI